MAPSVFLHFLFLRSFCLCFPMSYPFVPKLCRSSQAYEAFLPKNRLNLNLLDTEPLWLLKPQHPNHMLVSMMYQVLPKDWFTVDNQGCLPRSLSRLVTIRFPLWTGARAGPPQKCTHTSNYPIHPLNNGMFATWGPQALKNETVQTKSQTKSCFMQGFCMILLGRSQKKIIEMDTDLQKSSLDWAWRFFQLWFHLQTPSISDNFSHLGGCGLSSKWKGWIFLGEI